VARALPVVVIGAGQAGLAVSHELSGRGVDHIVLERRRVGQSWRDRWDSFCLVTPNWTMSLPGSRYSGEDPEGFVSRDEIVGYLERYAAGFGAPVYEGIGVRRTGTRIDESVPSTHDSRQHAGRLGCRMLGRLPAPAPP
jgi:putative flavoprotein involved in K+ transport